MTLFAAGFLIGCLFMLFVYDLCKLKEKIRRIKDGGKS